MEKIEVERFLSQQEFDMRMSWFWYYKQFEKDMDKVLTEMADMVCSYKTAELYEKIATFYDKAKKAYMETLM